MSVVRVSWPKARTRFGIAMAGLLLTGCGPSQPHNKVLPQPPATQHSFIWNTDKTLERVRNLSREADNLASDAKLLPGNDGTEHSRLMQRVFSDVLQTLPLLANPGEDRVMAQRMTIIQTSRAQLATGSRELAMEPAIDTALRAAGAALADISHGDNYEQADLGALLDKLSAQINRLDLERDPSLHRIDVADAVDLISQVVSKLAATLSARMAVEQPTTKP
jgi:hypothetical protein